MRQILALLPFAALLSGCVDIPAASKRQSSRPPSSGLAAKSPAARQCLAELGAMRANFTPLPDRYFAAGCTNLNTVNLASLRGDSASLELANLGPVTCNAANAFAGWARYGVDRAARQILGTPLVRIETFGSYNCRNVAGSNKRSGHATANAIDVSGFVFADGRRITLKGHWYSGSSAERRFLRVVHESACKRFGTVLGPEYNAAHKDHFHLEADGASFCR